MRRLRYIFNGHLLLPLLIFAGAYTITSLHAEAQDTSPDLQPENPTSSVVADSLGDGPSVFFNGVEIVIDYGKLLMIPSRFESKMELGLNLRFLDNLILAGEYGMASIDPLKAYDNAVYYTVEGRYYRFGMDYDISLDKKNHMSFGFRYGMSNFEDRGTILIESDAWEDYEEGFGDSGLSANWYELILGSETQLSIGKEGSKFFSQRFYLGWKFRFRILGNFENREAPSVYTIPGYGRTFDKTIPALNFHIKYRIGK